MTQGTVTMSLADIDNLRNEVKAATEAKRKIEDELKDVKNDKRVIKITKYPATVDLYVNIPSNLQPLTQQTITHVLNSIEGNRGIDNWGRSSYKM